MKQVLLISGLFFVVVLFAPGCTHCVLIHSEYYDVTGKSFAPKSDNLDIPILVQAPDKPFSEIGVVRVVAPWGTSDAAINAELKHRAREAGADALLNVSRDEDKNNQMVFCGKVFATKKSIFARGSAIVYTAPGNKGSNA